MKIAFLGDSLTEGWPGAAYLPLLEHQFPHHEVLNLGRAGDCVADLLRRLPFQDPGRVDLVVLWIGANDAVSAAMDATGGDDAWGWEARVARAVRDYDALLDWSASRAPAVVCVRPVVLEAEGSIWESHADELGDAMEERARALPFARIVDLRPAFARAAAAGRGPFTIDGVHFTDDGARVVAARLAEELERFDTDSEDIGRPVNDEQRAPSAASPEEAER
jgi:lysophospholipase L1-like esterase